MLHKLVLFLSSGKGEYKLQGMLNRARLTALTAESFTAVNRLRLIGNNGTHMWWHSVV